MQKIWKNIAQLWENPSLRKKIGYTILFLAIYRLLVVIPVPFVDVDVLVEQTTQTTGGLGFFLMLMGGSIEKFSLVAVGLSPFINASIIMQLLTVVVPKFEELQELGEQGTKQIQQYTRYLTFPLALVQSLGMVYIINEMMPNVIDISGGVFSLPVLGSAFILAIGAMVFLLLGDYITEKGLGNGVSVLIFASIVSGIAGSLRRSFSGGEGLGENLSIVVFIIGTVLVLVILSIFLLRSIKNISIVYAKQGKVNQTSSLPIPLNPVGMIPIIFAMAFTSFPYLFSELILKVGTMNQTVTQMAKWINVNLNMYAGDNVSWGVIIMYFVLIVVFTFFYTLIQFNPDKMADVIQKRGGFIPGIRPGEETANHINKILMHLCLRGGAGLAFLGIYNYLFYKIPVFEQIAMSLGGIPVVVTGAGIIIIVGVVQDLINKTQTEVLMSKYEEI